jgi:hypothetical protein
LKHLIFPGINIQWPWSELLLTGQKLVETRSYPLPLKHKDQWLAVIETPGPRGSKEAGIIKSRMTGLIQFADCFEYHDREAWLADHSRHLVQPDDACFGFDSRKRKWGWLVNRAFLFTHSIEAPKKRGIIYASACQIPISLIRNEAQFHSLESPHSFVDL